MEWGNCWRCYPAVYKGFAPFTGESWRPSRIPKITGLKLFLQVLFECFIAAEQSDGELKMWLQPCTIHKHTRACDKWHEGFLHYSTLMELMYLSPFWVEQVISKETLLLVRRHSRYCGIIVAIIQFGNWKGRFLSGGYRIYSNKRRGAYLIFRATSAALIRGHQTN